MHTIFLLCLLTSCSNTNLLTYHHRRFYKEACEIKKGQPFTLNHHVYYDPPLVIDAYFSHELSIVVLDTAAAKMKKRLDVEKDTNLIQVSYGVYSVWNWDGENNRITGQIRIKKWSNNQVRLKENLTVFDHRRDRVRKFRGVRGFRYAAPD
ncbi:MAG: hypothetical protein JNJ57_01965 [Saprospiraceae bacterium]|nr:hypothetical protein [Saprospiraceae bacterium]